MYPSGTFNWAFLVFCFPNLYRLSLMLTKETPTFRKTTETFTAGAKTLPQRYFISPDIFAKEREAIFSTQWVCVGHQSEIAKAGDYFVREVAGESLIIVRDKGGEWLAFYNVCR